jgi:hypothetical protein
MWKIFGSLKLNGIWGTRSKAELMDLYREADIISEIRKGRLQWLGRVERTPEERTVRKCSKISHTEKSVGKPRNRWLDNVENDLKKRGVRGCRKIARDRDTCKLTVTEARVLYGP